MPAYKDRVNKGFKEDRQGSRLRLRGRGARLTAIYYSFVPFLDSRNPRPWT